MVATGIARDAGASGSQADAKEDGKTKKKEHVGLVSQRQDRNLPGLSETNFMPGIEWSNEEHEDYVATGAAEESESGQVRQTGASRPKDDPGPPGVSVEPAAGVFDLINENDMPKVLRVIQEETESVLMMVLKIQFK